MRLTEIRGFIERRPFRPFKICISDGTVHEIRNPNLVFTTKHSLVVGVLRGDEVIPDHAAHYDPIHITRIETVEPEPPAA